MTAIFPGLLIHKNIIITELLHHTISELEGTIHVTIPISLFYIFFIFRANGGTIKLKSLVNVSWLLNYQIKSVKYLLSSYYTVLRGKVEGVCGH